MAHEAMAQAIGKALQDSGELDDLARQFLETIGPQPTHVAYDVGPDLWLVVYPNWTPLSRPQDFVHLAPRGP